MPTWTLEKQVFSSSMRLLQLRISERLWCHSAQMCASVRAYPISVKCYDDYSSDSPMTGCCADGKGKATHSPVLHHKMIPLGEKELLKTVDARVVGELLTPSSQKQSAFTVSSERKHVRTGNLSCLVYGRDCQVGKLTAECIQYPSCVGKNLVVSKSDTVKQLGGEL